MCFRLIRSKVLEDLARSLFPENVVNRLVYSSDDKVYEKKEFPVIENGQMFKCEVRAPFEPYPKNNTGYPSFGYEPNESPNLSAACPFERLVINLPSQDEESNSTSVSDDTWPGVYMDKQRLDTFDNPLTPPPDSTTSSRGGTPVTQDSSLKFDSHFESGNLRAAYQASSK